MIRSSRIGSRSRFLGLSRNLRRTAIGTSPDCALVPSPSHRTPIVGRLHSIKPLRRVRKSSASFLEQSLKLHLAEIDRSFKLADAERRRQANVAVVIDGVAFANEMSRMLLTSLQREVAELIGS